MRSRTTWRLLAVAALALGTVLSAAAPAGAWGYSVNEVQTAAEDPYAETGMGPGWVLLSYKANGPMVGYLFAGGFTFADGTVKPGPDHMDIRGTGDSPAGSATISRWPWGFSGGSFDGCAYAYGTRKFKITRTGFSSSSCANGPTVLGSSNSDGSYDTLRWWHSENVFCKTGDPLCSPYGVWSENKGGGLRATTTVAACPAYGNIGSAAAYGAGAARPTHLLGTAPAGVRIDVRYVTRDRSYVMAKWNGQRFAGGIAWAFFPRACLGS